MSTQALADPDGENISWLKLDLGKIFFVNKIHIYFVFYNYWYNPGAHCIQGEDRFKECANPGTNLDVSVYNEEEQKSCGTLQLTYGKDQLDQIYTLICNTEGDTVKLSRVAGYVKVFEVSVIGIALGMIIGIENPWKQLLLHLSI